MTSTTRAQIHTIDGGDDDEDTTDLGLDRPSPVSATSVTITQGDTTTSQLLGGGTADETRTKTERLTGSKAWLGTNRRLFILVCGMVVSVACFTIALARDGQDWVGVFDDGNVMVAEYGWSRCTRHSKIADVLQTPAFGAVYVALYVAVLILAMYLVYWAYRARAQPHMDLHIRSKFALWQHACDLVLVAFVTTHMLYMANLTVHIASAGLIIVLGPCQALVLLVISELYLVRCLPLGE